MKNIEKEIIELNQRLEAIAGTLVLDPQDSYVRIDLPSVGKQRLVFGSQPCSCDEAGIDYLKLMLELMEAVAEEKLGRPNKMASAARYMLRTEFQQLGERCRKLGWSVEPEADGIRITVPRGRCWQLPEDLSGTWNENDDYVESFNFNHRDFLRLCRIVRWAERAKFDRKYGVTPLSRLYSGGRGSSDLIEILPQEEAV